MSLWALADPSVTRLLLVKPGNLQQGTGQVAGICWFSLQQLVLAISREQSRNALRHAHQLAGEAASICGMFCLQGLH